MHGRNWIRLHQLDTAYSVAVIARDNNNPFAHHHRDRYAGVSVMHSELVACGLAEPSPASHEAQTALPSCYNASVWIQQSRDRDCVLTRKTLIP